MKRKSYHIFSMLVCITACSIYILSCKQETTYPLIKDKKIALRLEPSSGNYRNSEGDFIRLSDGSILFIYTHFTEGTGDHDSAYLAARISTDDGKTWSSKDQIIVPNEGQMNTMSVSLIRMKNKKIALFYLRKNSDSDCIPMKRISADEGKTWSSAQRCISTKGYYVMNNDRVVRLKNGLILLPVSLHKTPETERSEIGKIFCYYSQDSGETWENSPQVPNPENIQLQEPGIIELKDGKVLMFCRTKSGLQYLSLSEDSGKSWSAVYPSKIKSPLSPASIERIPDTGDLLLVWNNNFEPQHGGAGRRTPFNIAISKDEGKNWENIKIIENNPDGWYCYTAIEFVKDNILLAHCAGNRKQSNGLESTQITLLKLDQVYSK